MKHLVRLSLVTALALTAWGCEKEGGSASTKSSGAPSEAENALLAHIPAGANVVFGGNYQKLMEYWENSPLKQLSETMMAAGGGDQSDKLRDYMTCWVEQKTATDMLGSMDLTSDGMAMTMIFRGLDENTLTSCAEKGGYTFTKSDDGKYLELQNVPTGMGQTTNVGYYFIDPKTAFFSMEAPMGLAASGNIPMPTRAELEAKLAEAKKSPATGDPQFMKLIGMADRSKPLWFAGSTAGTPLAGQADSGHGWIDADKNSMTIGFEVVLGQEEMAKMAVEQFKQAKGSLGMLPPDLKSAAESFLESAKLEASGKTLKGRFKITNDMLNKAIPAFQSMMGGMGGM